MTDPIATQRVYDQYAEVYDQNRNKSLFEKDWLDAFTQLVVPGGHILDLGCGSAEPIAGYLIECGFRVTGMDASPAMIALAKARYPNEDWQVRDMRHLPDSERYDGVIAWNSFFHLTRLDQQTTLPRLAQALRPGAPLMFTTGTSDGEALGTVAGQPVYHASLTSQHYEDILTDHGCAAKRVVLEDATCNLHSVFLAQKNAAI